VAPPLSPWGRCPPLLIIAKTSPHATLSPMSQSAILSIRLTEGDVFIHLDKVAFSPALRSGIKDELPEAIVAPISDARVSFLRSRVKATTLFGTPHHQTCPILVETTASGKRSSGEVSKILRAVITAMRKVIPSGKDGSRPS